MPVAAGARGCDAKCIRPYRARRGCSRKPGLKRLNGDGRCRFSSLMVLLTRWPTQMRSQYEVDTVVAHRGGAITGENELITAFSTRRGRWARATIMRRRPRKRTARVRRRSGR